MTDKEDFNTKYLRDRTTHEQWKEEFYRKTVQELQTEERFVNYFKQFEPKSVETFIKNYASRKVIWYDVGESMRKYRKSKQAQWQENCFKALIHIQQKKLFDAQCLWRAGKAKFEGIDICYDFKYWDNHIIACPVIPPVSQEEIDFFFRYLRETSFEGPFDNRILFQEHDEILKSYRMLDDGWAYIPWYRFCDEELGTYSYLELPDVMGEKEEFYMQLHRDDYQKKNRKEIDERNAAYLEQLPYLSYYEDNFVENFIKENESPAYYRLYVEHKRFIQKSDRLDTPQYHLGLLQEIPGNFMPVEPADDWTIAVSATYERYRRECLMEEMPRAYKLYLKHLGEDWNYPGKITYISDAEGRLAGLGKLFRDMIINGRVLNNEPADLNY